MKKCLVITGATGVGKTDFAHSIMQDFPNSVMINADLGQFFQKLSIGTAKPEFIFEKTRYFLFDFLKNPQDFSVFEYRKIIIELINQLIKDSKIPIVVGGSGFYIRSLFFPAQEYNNRENIDIKIAKIEIELSSEKLWEKLNLIDPIRAKEIAKNDRYRIERALKIWYQTGVAPSKFKPQFKADFSFSLINLYRDRNQMYEFIDSRVIKMLQIGWIDEVRNLSPDWINFIKRKNIIGYPEIADYISKETNSSDKLNSLILQIQQKTRNYAKRQVTFFNGFSKQMLNLGYKTEQINLTSDKIELYINQLKR